MTKVSPADKRWLAVRVRDSRAKAAEVFMTKAIVKASRNLYHIFGTHTQAVRIKGRGMDKNFMTRASYERMQSEITDLREKQLVKIAREKLEAASQGDLSENAGYEYAKQKMEMIQNKILAMEALITNPQFIEELPIGGVIVSIGTIVRFLDLDKKKEEQFSILGPADADVASGVISFQSPLAKGMITKKVGDEVTIAIPEGTRKIKILEIKKYAGA